MWPDRRLLELLGVEMPIVQAPMAGAMDWELAAAAAQAGALGSLPCAMLNADQVREQVEKIRAHTTKPINLGFFCHAQPVLNNQREARWRERLAPYYPCPRATVAHSTANSARLWRNSNRTS
jgi:nitronate monooxygenase